MSYADFDKGIPAAQVNRRREAQLEQQARNEHSLIEDLLSILRPRGESHPRENEKFELWKTFK
jgi:hypothetical protein